MHPVVTGLSSLFAVAEADGTFEERSPAATPSGARASMRTNSSSVRLTAVAPAFSSRRERRLVPGIGTTSSPCASSHAKASCPGVTPFAAAIALIAC